MESPSIETQTLKSTPLWVYSGDFGRALLSVPPAEQMTDFELDGYQQLFANVTRDLGRCALLCQAEIDARAKKAAEQ
ncbi:hypothetical protein GTC6_05462 [Gordonia terrae C-6]|uniref:Uncharacterized protein n=1 Tax=Gordonia terrae C-6 TaxID=1316928 RepID=R7YDH2_9ACTN|nr:hypothetical protein [Gordonia terrae]EON33789.1 hypothetical protein GTC6_05462 [Gordonia terrae C-6]